MRWQLVFKDGPQWIMPLGMHALQEFPLKFGLVLWPPLPRECRGSDTANWGLSLRKPDSFHFCPSESLELSCKSSCHAGKTAWRWSRKVTRRGLEMGERREEEAARRGEEVGRISGGTKLGEGGRGERDPSVPAPQPSLHPDTPASHPDVPVQLSPK